MTNSALTLYPAKNLPPREWFTLELVAKRWGCQIEDILQYGQTDKLRISQNFASVKAIFRYFDESIFPPLQEYQSTFTACPFGISSEDITRLANGNPPFQPRILFTPGPVISNQGRFSSAEVIESDPVSLQSLIIITEELIRFEGDNFLNLEKNESISPKEKEYKTDWKIRAQEIADDWQEDEKKEVKAIKIAEQLAKEGIYGRGEKPVVYSTVLREVLQTSSTHRKKI